MAVTSTSGTLDTPPNGFNRADDVRSRNVRQGNLLADRTPAHQGVVIVESGGLNAHQDMAGAHPGCRQVAHAEDLGSAKTGQVCCFHCLSPSFRLSKIILPAAVVDERDYV